MKIPQPGQPVRGSKTGRPIMALFDMLGRKAALRILWELRGGALNFRALEHAAETNPSVLNTRLREMRAAGIVELTENGYQLTGEGADLIDRLLPLTQWADGWARRMNKREK